MNSYLDVALQLGVILALLGIIWNCIQMVFGTLEQRKFLVDTITKWFLFIFILVIYPGASRGLRSFSIQLASYVSSANIDDIANEFGQYMESLEKALVKEIADADKIINDIKQKRQDSSFDTILNIISPIHLAQEEIMLYSAEKRKEDLNLNGENPKGKAKTINAIRSILIVDEQSISKKYTIDLSMKDSNGIDTGYLSPNAMLRMSVISAQIMWQKVWEDDVLKTWEEDKQKGLIIKDKGIFDFPFRKIWDMLLCFICEILIVVITCIELVQYVMCIIEFIVCVTFGIVLIPCMLFDPLKDMSSKLLPSLLSQAVKLSMITICMYFCCYTYLDMAKTTIANTASFSLWDFSYVVFTCLLTFALCSNAPKLASALLTGQPQMSMGEFVQAAGAIAGGAALAAKGVETTRKGIGSSARFAANRLGDLAAVGGGMKQGFENAVNSGKGGFKGLMSGLGGGTKVAASRTGRRIQGGLQNMANYRGKGNSGGVGGASGSGGSNRYSSISPNNTAHSIDALATEKDFEKAKRNSRNYDSHYTETGAKSTLAEYLRAQAESGRGVVGNKVKLPPAVIGGNGGTNTNTENNHNPPMPPSVPPSFGSHVSFTPKMRNVTPKPESLPPSGLPSPGKKRLSDGKNKASDVDYNIS